jgi:SPP1 family predicted phage head-tail adaptor
MPKVLNPGKFRHKISFYSPPEEHDDYGELADEWILFKTVSASKEPLIGNEFYTALTAETKVEVKFRLRYTSGINDTMRIKCGDELYEILSAVDFESAHIELLCYCRLLKL